MVKIKTILVMMTLMLCSPALALDTHISKTIDNYIHSQMQEGKIPGLSLIIVSHNETWIKGYGVSDLETKQPVSNATTFELGSNSKAFTALAIYLLNKQNLINLDTAVSHYLPWFKMKYNNRPVAITIRQCLHHTSGIPFNSIGLIKPDNTPQALENTVRQLLDLPLIAKPGEQFMYATINYDILGLIIEKTTGMAFETFIQQNILQRLSLENTYIGQSQKDNHKATGYKYSFLRPVRFQAPIYRGNYPAGYFCANSIDTAKWLKIQLNPQSAQNDFTDLIKQTQTPNRSVPVDSNSYYAGGWIVLKQPHDLFHSGSNPNYSSHIMLNPEQQIGIAVLTNLNSGYSITIGEGVMAILRQQSPQNGSGDLFKSMDYIASVLLMIFLPLLCFVLYISMRLLRQFEGFILNLKKTIHISLISILCLLLTALLYRLPDILFSGLPWDFIFVWGPLSFIMAICLIALTAVCFNGYLIIKTLSVRQRPDT